MKGSLRIFGFNALHTQSQENSELNWIDNWKTSPDVTRRQIVRIKVTRHHAKLSISILSSTWKWVYLWWSWTLLDDSSDNDNKNYLGQTTATVGNWKRCQDLCQCWHQEGSLHKRGNQAGHIPDNFVFNRLLQEFSVLKSYRESGIRDKG